MPRYYVTMTLENWPQGGLRKSIITAASPAEAQHLLRLREAERRVAAARSRQKDGTGSSEELDREWWLARLSAKWHVVACIDVQELLATLSGGPEEHLPVTPADIADRVADSSAAAQGCRDRRSEVARIVASAGRRVWQEASALPAEWTTRELARHVGKRFLAHCLRPDDGPDPEHDPGKAVA